MSSPDRRYDTIYISNYALVNVLDELRRIAGRRRRRRSSAPPDYSMRIWLRPDKVAQYNLTPSDIAAAIREQNAQFAAGRFGEEPMPGEPGLHLLGRRRRAASPIRASSSTSSCARTRTAPPCGSRTSRASSSARRTTATVATLNGAPTVPIGIYLQPGANALDVAAPSTPAWMRSRGAFPTGSATTSRSTPPTSSRPRSKR